MSTVRPAPFLVVGAPAVVVGLDDSSRPDRSAAITLGVVSLALALLAVVGEAIGAMQGPAFEGFPNSVIEALVFGVVGSAAGVGFRAMADSLITDRRPRRVDPGSRR